MNEMFNPTNDLRSLLDWWSNHMFDRDAGGCYGSCNNDNVVNKLADRSAVMNTRVLWTFSAAARTLSDDKYASAAKHVYTYLNSKFLDNVNGGYYWLINAAGEVVDNKKQIYAQAFGLYALSEYYRIQPDESIRSEALKIFDLIEQYGRDKTLEGYIEAFSGNWESLEDLRLSAKDLNAEKTMNTHLHVLEAYTNLYRIAPLPKVKEALRSLIQLFLSNFIDPTTFHLHLFFDREWNNLASIDSYGHDIECSWLLVEAAEVLGDDSLLQSVKKAAVKMADITLQEGTDEDSAIFNEKDQDHLDADKHWWPQAEAVVGFFNAYQLSGNAKFLDAAKETYNFIQDTLYTGDGEWFWKTTKDGVVQKHEDKAGPWKAPYHNGRMYLELLHRKAKL